MEMLGVSIVTAVVVNVMNLFQFLPKYQVIKTETALQKMKHEKPVSTVIPVLLIILYVPFGMTTCS